MTNRVQVQEDRREICFENGSRLNLTNVVWYDNTGTYLRVGCDQGVVFINPDKVLWHKAATKKVDKTKV